MIYVNHLAPNHWFSLIFSIKYMKIIVATNINSTLKNKWLLDFCTFDIYINYYIDRAWNISFCVMVAKILKKKKSKNDKFNNFF